MFFANCLRVALALLWHCKPVPTTEQFLPSLPREDNKENTSGKHLCNGHAPIDNGSPSGYNKPKRMAVVTLYTKPGCHLCDEAREALLRVKKGQPFELEEVNINEDAGLLAEYGEQIPVVLLNGAFSTEYAVDEARLRQLLQELH